MSAAMDIQTDQDDSEQLSDAFVCCVCLDLLYKPIVLSCGHVACFWCVHISMNAFRESRCPICRGPYFHFPTVCQMLHFLLVKMYPLTYKRRQKQVLEEEKERDSFSPDIDKYDGKLISTSVNLDSKKEEEDSVKPNEKEICDIPIEGTSCSGSHQQVSVADLSCVSCKQLLFRPVVLNCGHVYCETCLVVRKDETLKCEFCESPHPRGFPKVCFELHHFLEEKFPTEYALRKNIAQLKQVPSPKEPDTNPSKESDSSSRLIIERLSDLGSKVHAGVGCDSCGMYPIKGDRYKCNDCEEAVGFDLCGDCYNTRSKLPGRFNQRHTPEHTFVKIESLLSEVMMAMWNSRPHINFDFPELSFQEEEPLETQVLDLNEDPVDEQVVDLNEEPQDEESLVLNEVPLDVHFLDLDEIPQDEQVLHHYEEPLEEPYLDLNEEPQDEEDDDLIIPNFILIDDPNEFEYI